MKPNLTILRRVLFASCVMLFPLLAWSQTTQQIVDAACPCDGPNGVQWTNHGAYVNCVTAKVNALASQGTISTSQKNKFIFDAGQNACGKPRSQKTDDGAGSPGILTLNGDPESSPQPLSLTLNFTLTNAQFSLLQTDHELVNNGIDMVPQSIDLQNTTLSFTVSLNQGINKLMYIGSDAAGFLLSYRFTIWAGNRTLPVTVLNDDGTAATNVTVKAILSDDPDVTATLTDANNQVTFDNLPARTFIVNASTADNRFATAAVVPSGSPVVLKLSPFKTASSIDNNDFSLGTDGWETGTSPVNIVPHVEGTSPLTSNLPSNTADVPEPDNDLMLSTSGEGPQSVFRTFNTAAGTNVVKVRFRFITSEVPGGFFGSQFNDFYAVVARSQNTNTNVVDQNSMNGLGLSAFDLSDGSTAWRELVLPVKSTGDVVQIDVTVANVGDGILDSHVVIDFVQERRLHISAFVLQDPTLKKVGDDFVPRPLTHISLDNHTYLNGKTLIRGTITIEGAETDQLTDLRLEVLKGSTVVATGTLIQSTQTAPLMEVFGTDKRVSIGVSQLLFEIPSGPAIKGKVQLRLVAKTETETSVREAGSFTALNRYTNSNRYGPRNLTEGGDDWAKPSVIVQANGFPSTWTFGDFSNMNGGHMSPHADHDEGIDIDAFFSGFSQRNATTAETFITFLNSAAGSNVLKIYVTFTDAFRTAITNKTLTNGKAVTDIIRNKADHDTHFHLVINADAADDQRLAFWDDWDMKRESGNQMRSTVILKTYPNPASDWLNVEHPALAEYSNETELVVTDPSGKIMITQKLSGSADLTPVNISRLAAGAYLFKLTDNHRLIGTGKFSVIR